MACQRNRQYNSCNNCNNCSEGQNARCWNKVIYTTQTPVCNETAARWLAAMQTAARSNCDCEETTVPANCSEKCFSMLDLIRFFMHLMQNE